MNAQLQVQARQLASGGGDGEELMRERVGEFVGNVFYGTLLRQSQESNLKGPFGHGGRGEEVFRGQLNMELAKRLGTSKNDPIAERLYESIRRGLPGARATQSAADIEGQIGQSEQPAAKEQGAS